MSSVCSVHVCICVVLNEHVQRFVGRYLATKVFIGKLLATGGVWVIVG